MDPGPSFDAESVERDLLRRPIRELKGIFRRSSNYTFLAELAGAGEAPPLLAVYKPAQGESPLWDFPDRTLYRREVAAYRLARALGWPRIPPTVIRQDAPHGVGAVQMFVEADPGSHYLVDGSSPRETWIEVAAFDVVANNADRKSGHCLTDAEGRVWVIDHGLTFHAEPKLRTVIWDFAGERLPARLRAALAAVAGELEGGPLEPALGELISDAELAALRHRVEAMLKPRFRLPHPTSGWSVPWPPV